MERAMPRQCGRDDPQFPLNEGLIKEVDAPKTTDSDDARRRYYRVTKRGRTRKRAVWPCW
jgi:hypothetical protein